MQPMQCKMQEETIPASSGAVAGPEAETEADSSRSQTEEDDEEKKIEIFQRMQLRVIVPGHGHQAPQQIRTGGGIPARRRARLRPCCFFFWVSLFCQVE